MRHKDYHIRGPQQKVYKQEPQIYVQSSLINLQYPSEMRAHLQDNWNIHLSDDEIKMVSEYKVVDQLLSSLKLLVSCNAKLTKICKDVQVRKMASNNEAVQKLLDLGNQIQSTKTKLQQMKILMDGKQNKPIPKKLFQRLYNRIQQVILLKVVFYTSNRQSANKALRSLQQVLHKGSTSEQSKIKKVVDMLDSFMTQNIHLLDKMFPLIQQKNFLDAMGQYSQLVQAQFNKDKGNRRNGKLNFENQQQLRITIQNNNSILQKQNDDYFDQNRHPNQQKQHDKKPQIELFHDNHNQIIDRNSQDSSQSISQKCIKLLRSRRKGVKSDVTSKRASRANQHSEDQNEFEFLSTKQLKPMHLTHANISPSLPFQPQFVKHHRTSVQLIKRNTKTQQNMFKQKQFKNVQQNQNIKFLVSECVPVKSILKKQNQKEKKKRFNIVSMCLPKQYKVVQQKQNRCWINSAYKNRKPLHMRTLFLGSQYFRRANRDLQNGTPKQKSRKHRYHKSDFSPMSTINCEIDVKRLVPTRLGERQKSITHQNTNKQNFNHLQRCFEKDNFESTNLSFGRVQNAVVLVKSDLNEMLGRVFIKNGIKTPKREITHNSITEEQKQIKKATFPSSKPRIYEVYDSRCRNIIGC